MITTGLRPPPVRLQGSRNTASWFASRCTAACGTDQMSSGTNPSHGNVHSCTANPKRAAEPRPPPRLKLSMNPRSFRVNVKNLINSSLPMSGYDRSRSICSSEKN
ncbi:hypothetical protein FHR32_007208 [Streptosporangium album]|uniref:Uncharacterized protein n=1 Tax=Streptosporangium album TaxID=47479 RepID=A0A7W7WDG6_9ACTN|nr:hypothetical protein [Streptosporangium album]